MDESLNRELVDTVSEVQETTFDFSPRGLSTGTYNIQVGCPYELYNCLYVILSSEESLGYLYIIVRIHSSRGGL